MKGKAGLVLATLLIAAGAMTATHDLASAQEDGPEAVVLAQAERFEAGDRTGWLSFYSDDVVITDVGVGSTAYVGLEAAGWVFDIIVSFELEATVTDTEVNGSTVVQEAEWSDVNSDAAGISRYLTVLTSVVEDGKIQRSDLRYVEDDAETQTYLEFIASAGDPIPPGPIDTVMSGTQPGTAWLTPYDTMTWVDVSVAAGADGVLQPARLARGTCAAPGTPISPLAPVLGGTSLTLVSAPVEELRSAALAVRVDESPTSTATVACGEVEAAVAPAPPPAAASPAPAPVSAPNAGYGQSSGALAFEVWSMLAAFSAAVLIAAGVYARRQP